MPVGLLRRNGTACFPVELGSKVSILESWTSWPKLFALESVPLNTSAECLLCTKQKTSQRGSASYLALWCVIRRVCTRVCVGPQ